MSQLLFRPLYRIYIEFIKKSLYDTSYFDMSQILFLGPLSQSIFQDDASESMKEMSTRARRTRKSAQEEAASGRLERQTSKDNRKDSKDGWRDSKDDISKKVSHDR